MGTSATAIQAVPHLESRRPAPVRFPAHALLGRRPGQRPHRPRVGKVLEPGWQRRRPGQLPSDRHRRRDGRGHGRRRLDQLPRLQQK
ncbi:hypothetical protein LV779_08595 [Streptomyces thinghirensis]|nr:hypothetical protein [Streptomyces thinghirensis]